MPSTRSMAGITIELVAVSACRLLVASSNFSSSDTRSVMCVLVADNRGTFPELAFLALSRISLTARHTYPPSNDTSSAVQSSVELVLHYCCHQL